MPVSARFAFLAAFPVLAALTGLAQAQAPRPRPQDECILNKCQDRQPAGPSEDRQPAGLSEDRQPAGQREDRPADRPYGRDRFQTDRQGSGPGQQGDRYGSRGGRFDFYVLSLSWSPSFCASDAGQRSREQCAYGARNAFVVHGLWPQFERGFPSYCDDRPAPRFALEQARGVFPEEGLARYEWRKHGTCSGLSPTDYFQAARRARDMVTIPEEFRAPGRALQKDPSQVERAFIEANRTLRPGMLAVTCTRRGQLEEVRICLSKDLREFRPCPEVVRQACRLDTVNVPQPR